MNYTWMDWHISMWNIAGGYAYIACKGKFWRTGEIGGTLAQARLVLAAKLNK
jgi:hypothetical protein